MISGSLRLRLIGAAALGVALALAISGVVLARLFTQHVEARADAELTTHLNQIVAALEIAPDGKVQVAVSPADPRFDKPGSGLYWQIVHDAATVLRSRSLWDTVLTLPDDNLPQGAIHRHAVKGPDGSPLITLERGLVIGPDASPVPVRLTVALDRREIADAEAGFRAVLFRSLLVLGLALLAALWLQVQVGLRPLAALRRALNHVREGVRPRIEGGFPTEVQPLVHDMNALLDRERRNIERARERASDLAHGFKTPLTVLSAVTRELVDQGRADTAREIEAQVDIMSRHVQRELALARTVGSATVGRVAVPVRPVVERIIKALRRIASDRDLVWQIDIDEDARFPGDENDLLEVVGNLVENAAKWAATRVSIRASAIGDGLRLAVADDGPGIPSGAEEEVLRRGRRLDEAADGSGLGLSIVTKMVETYGGSITLGRAAIGGLEAIIDIPQASRQSSSK